MCELDNLDKKSKCQTKLLNVIKEDKNKSSVRMMLKADFSRSNGSNENRLAELLNRLIPKE